LRGTNASQNSLETLYASYMSLPLAEIAENMRCYIFIKLQ
jgi:hypothetical protein